MVRHTLFSKGETIYALLSNYRHPNVVFPVQCIVHDIKFDELMPQYLVRINHFYDEIDFLKRYFFGLTFRGDFENKKQVKFKLKRQLYRKIEDLERQVAEKWETYLIAVDSVFCVKTKAEQIELFNSLQDFFVEKTMKELYETTNRAFYSKGQYYYHSKGEFEASLKKFLAQRAPTDPDYYDKLLFRPLSSDLDKIEIL